MENQEEPLSLVLFKPIPCQMTMGMMGLRREDLIDGLEEPAGATTALLNAQGANTLFN